MSFTGNLQNSVVREQPSGPLPAASDYNIGDTAWLEDQQELFRVVDGALGYEWRSIGPLERFREFSFSSGTISLQSVIAGARCTRVVVVITTPFDDPAATIAVGTAGNPSLLMSATDSNPAKAHQYDNPTVTVFSVNDTLQVAINPGASTQGAGFVLYQYQGVP